MHGLHCKIGSAQCFAIFELILILTGVFVQRNADPFTNASSEKPNACFYCINQNLFELHVMPSVQTQYLRAEMHNNTAKPAQQQQCSGGVKHLCINSMCDVCSGHEVLQSRCSDAIFTHFQLWVILRTLLREYAH